MEQQALEKMIREAILAMAGGESQGKTTVYKPSGAKATVADYPLSKNRPELIKSATGKGLDAFTVDNVMNGTIGADDCRISPETLAMQADIAEGDGRKNFADNLRRAAELIAVPDGRILEIYDKLRPYRSTKAEMMAIADELENKYSAVVNARLVREAATLYEKRDRLKK